MGCCCSKVGGKSPKKDENVIDDEGGRESNFVNPSASPAQEYSYTNSQAKEGSNDVTYPKRPDIVAAVDGHLDGQFVTSNPMAKLRIKGGASDLPDLSGRNNATLEPQKHSENSDTNKTSQLDEENELSYESMKTRETFISENPITSTHEDRPIDSKPATITGNTTSNSDADVVQDLDYESMRTRETFISENPMISVGEMTTIVGGSNPLKSTSPLPSASLPASPPQSDAQQPLPPQSITESSPPSETKRSLLPPPISEPMAPRPNAFLSQKLRPGGILGLPVGGGGLGSLKTKVETEFIAISIPPAEERWVMSVSDQMRFIDGIRMYKPLNSECAALNIPDDRLNINHLKSILYLSGCQKGKRFTTDEYKVVRAIVDLMGPLSTAMEELFHSLSLPMKKRKLQGGPYVTYTSAQFENWKSLRDCGRADTIKDGVSGTDSMSTGGTDGVSESSASERGESTAPVIAVADSDAHEVIYFHCLAGQYLEKIQQVQTFVKQKRQSPEEGETLVFLRWYRYWWYFMTLNLSCIVPILIIA